MKVLVTGATGLLGSNVVRILLENGHHVKVFLRPSCNLVALNGLDYEKTTGNLLNKRSIIKAATDCDVIIHAAANTSQCPTSYENYEPVNVNGTKNILEAAKILGTSKIVYVSTCNAIGFGSKTQPGNELTEFNSITGYSGYIFSKYIAQQVVLNEVEKNKLPAVIVNPSFMIGKQDAKPSSGQVILMAYKKKILYYPSGGRNFIHVRDAAIGVYNAILNGRIGESYLLTNENLSYKEFYNKVCLVAGMSPFKIKIPAFAIKPAGLINSICSSMLKKSTQFNFANALLLTLGKYYSSNKAVKELNLPQTAVEQAIEDALEWFGRHGYLTRKHIG
ncbi:NAD-dependent epimerase/dehydratase family protein [Bacteroidota bacterium]